MGAEEPAGKRAKRDHAPTDVAAAFAVPPADEPLHQPAVASALQQLYKAYKVEYYSLLEQLRTQAHQPQQQGSSVAPATTEAAAAAAAKAGGPMRQQLRGGNAPDASSWHDPAGEGGSSMDQQQQQYGDDVCGYGSDTDPPTCTEAAAAASAAGAAAPGVGAEQMAQWRRRFSGAEGHIVKLEQVACGAALQYMDAQGVLACLSGINGCYLIRRAAVNLGRYSDAAGEVDIDLALEAAAPAVQAGGGPSVPPTPAAAAATAATDEGGTTAAPPPPAAAAAPAAAAGTGDATEAPATSGAGAAPGATAAAAAAGGGGGGGAGGLGAAQQVSRLQAQLALQDNGTWQITNLGRRAITVDGTKVLQGQSASLRQLSLVQVAAINLLFLVNGLAVQRLLARSQALNM